MPVWQVLGGAARDRIRTYNTCGGPGYGRAAKGGTGYGTENARGKYEDLVAFMERPDELALDLLSEGLTGMKIWPFDYVAHFPGMWADWRSFRGMFDPDLRSLGGHDITAADLALNGAVEVALVGDPDSPAFREMAGVLATRYTPSLVVAGGAAEAQSGIALMDSRVLRDGRATAYVCRNYACDEPVTDAAALARQLDHISPTTARP